MRAKPCLSIVRDCRGTTIIEFAVVAPLFFLLFFAALEFGLYTFTQMSLEMAVAEAGRNVSISTTKCTDPNFDRVAAFKADVTAKTKSLINGSHVQISADVIGAGGKGGVPAAPDICLTSPPSLNSSCPEGTPFIDNNGNGVYDDPSKVNLGGCSPDEVELRVSLPWNVQFPFVKSLFTAKDSNGKTVQGIAMLSATTIIKNESNN